jgi:hypothetical protein
VWLIWSATSGGRCPAPAPRAVPTLQQDQYTV